MTIIKRLSCLVKSLEDSALVLAFFLMLLLTLMQIVLRNFFDVGLTWAESLLKIMVLWVALLGAMIATREGQHIKIDLFDRFLRESRFSFLSKVVSFFAAYVCGLAAYSCCELVYYEYMDGTKAFSEVPVWLCQIIMPIAFSVMGFRFLRNVWNS